MSESTGLVIPGDYPGIVAARFAVQEIGIPYVWGGDSTKGFDCSGLAMYVYAHVGIVIPRTTEEQYLVEPVPLHGPRYPGDLLFFEGTPPGHVMILFSAGIAIEAPHTGEVVKKIAYPQDEVVAVTRPSLLKKPYKLSWPK
jgi:cell wall-associated NlpC family hydrolase